MLVPTDMLETAPEKKKKEPTNEAPGIPEGFKRDLKQYGEAMGRNYRLHWNPLFHIWVIQVEGTQGEGWVECIALIDWETHDPDDNPYPFRQPDRRAIEELYASDIFVKFATGNPDLDRAKWDAAQREACRISHEKFERSTADMFGDIGKDARHALKRLDECVDNGHSHGFKGVHQVHANMPSKGG
jgi:hypothetical protein